MVHFLSPCSKKQKRIRSKEISYLPWKWNLLDLILKNFLYFLKRKFLLYFKKQKPKKYCLYFRKQNSYNSVNRNSKKPFIFSEVTFRAQNIKKATLKKLLIFREMELSSPLIHEKTCKVWKTNKKIFFRTNYNIYFTP